MRVTLRVLRWVIVVLLVTAVIVWVLPVVAALCIWFGVYKGLISGRCR